MIHHNFSAKRGREVIVGVSVRPTSTCTSTSHEHTERRVNIDPRADGGRDRQMIPSAAAVPARRGLMDAAGPRTTTRALYRTRTSGRWLPSALGQPRTGCNASQARACPPRPQALLPAEFFSWAGEKEQAPAAIAAKQRFTPLIPSSLPLRRRHRATGNRSGLPPALSE